MSGSSAHRRSKAGHWLSLGVCAILALSFAFSLGSVQVVNAATAVTQPIRITVDNSGPAANATLVGCGVFPTRIPLDGAAHSFTATSRCTILIIEPFPGAGTRYRFGGLSTARVVTCSIGLCEVVNRTAYFELYNTYDVVANAQSGFDQGLGFRVTGSVGGLLRSTVCTISTRSIDASRSCSGWSDYNKPVTVPTQPSHQARGTRWAPNSTSVFRDVTGRHTHVINYFKQVSKNVNYAVLGVKGTGYTPPALSFVRFGTHVSYNVTTRFNLTWVDYGTIWSLPNPLMGSGVAERWYTNSAVTGTALASGTIRPSYYHQYNDTFRYAMSDGSTPTGPSVSYRQFGGAVSRPVPPVGFTDWMNAGTSATYPRALAGSGPAARWTALTLTFPSGPSASFTPVYYHQYLVAFGYSTVDSSTIASGATLASYRLYGNPSHFITSNGAGGVSLSAAWVDAGVGTLSYINAVAPSGTDRWALSSSPDPKDVTASTTISETGYRHQVGLVLSYSLAGGGSPVAPAVTCTSIGAPLTTTLGISAKTYWCDNGGTWMVSPTLLTGSGLTERWQTLQTLSGAVIAPRSAVYVYYHQYLMTFTRTILDGGSPLDPSVAFAQFGASASAPATSSAASVWVDAQSSYVYTNPTADSTAGERWVVPHTPTDIIVASVTVNPSYYHQFKVPFAYTTNDATTSNPAVSYVQFGVGLGLNATMAGSVVWADATAAFSYANPTAGSSSTERWRSAVALTGAISSSSTITTVYYHQFLMTFQYSVIDGSTPTNTPGVAYVQFGGALVVPSTTPGAAVWADATSTYTYDNPTLGSPVGERWAGSATQTGTVTGSNTLNPEYFHQFKVTFAYTTNDAVALPTGNNLVSYTQFGGIHVLTTTASYGVLSKANDWADASTSVIYSSPVTISISERYQITSADIGTRIVITSVTAVSATANPAYYHQFKVSFAFTTSDATSITSGTSLVTYSQFGSTVTLTTTTTYGQLSKTSDWANAATPVNYVSPFVISASERDQIDSTDSGTNAAIVSVSGASSTANPEYFHQFRLTLSYSTSDGSTPGPAPVFTAKAFGVTDPTTLTTSTQLVWYDISTNPSAYTESDPIPASPTTEKWVINTGVQADHGVITSAFTVSFLYYHQYLDTLRYTVSGGGSPAAPVVGFTSMGSAATQAAATGTSSTAWIDAGTTVTYPATITDGVTVWTTGTTMFTASSSTSFNPTYA